MTLERLALSRSTLDRAAHHRSDPTLLQRLLQDRATAVLPIVDGRAPVHDVDGETRLTLLSAGDLTGAEPSLVLYLGEDSDHRQFVAVAWIPEAGDAAGNGSAGSAPAEPPRSPQGSRWAGLREVGSLLDDSGAGMLTTAVALAAWHAGHPRCARCGTGTDVVQAGWSRLCPQCGAEHWPRTDPAVIMSVVDAEDRILLGHQAAWPPGRFSTLAGFVEPGESLEAAVRREVDEEAGITIGAVTYRGSQPWPFPSSLMVGFRAVAESTEIHVDGTELADARWWSREQMLADLGTGALLLPPRVSIARRLIEDWFGGPIDVGGDVWR